MRNDHRRLLKWSGSTTAHRAAARQRQRNEPVWRWVAACGEPCTTMVGVQVLNPAVMNDCRRYGCRQ